MRKALIGAKAPPPFAEPTSLPSASSTLLFMALARSSYPIVLPLCKGPPVSERPSPWLPSRNGLLGQLGLACRDRVGDRRAGLVAAPLLGGVEFFELGRVGDSLHRGDHLIGRLFQLGGQPVLAVAAFLRLRRPPLFRRNCAACARGRGGHQVPAQT